MAVEIVCDECGERNPPRARFCLGCGTPFHATGDAARKLVTVLFADVVGSTALGERLDPEPLRELMLTTFRRVEAIIAFHGGTVEKFIGDAVMAIFGIPTAHEDDALRAVRAAVEMREEVARLDRELVAQHGVTLQLRTGINTGEVMTGGGRQTLVTGDAVNLAARLEQAAPPGGILLGPTTAALVRGAVVGEVLDPISVKGKEEPVVPTLLVSVASASGSLPRRHDSPLVGRDDEMAVLDRAFEQAVEGGGAWLVTVVGGPGVGKSRLVQECLVRWAPRCISASGTCPPYGHGITYWPLREAITSLMADAKDDPGVALERLVGDRADAHAVVEDVLALAGLRPDAAVTDGIASVRVVLEAASAAQPVVVVLDDAQWAEPGLLDLVEHVQRWWRGGSLLAVVVTRPELLSTRHTWQHAGPHSTTLRLEPLSAGEASDLTTSLVQGSVPADQVDAIVHMAGGNPLFIEELAADAAMGWAEGTPRLPAGVRTLLAARLDRLDNDDRVVLQRASVVGETFERETVVALTPTVERPQLPNHLLALLHEDLLRAQTDAVVERYDFRHLLLRDVTYESLPKRDRAEIHEQLASYLEGEAVARDVELAELVGHHLEQAVQLHLELGTDEPARRALAHRAGLAFDDAGRRAQARGDVRGAVVLLQRAATWLDGHPREPLVLGALGSVLTEVGDLDDAAAVLDRAVAIAEARGDEPALVHARLFRLWLQSAVDPAGWTAAARATAEHAVEVFTRVDDALGLARAWVMLAEVAWSSCHFAEVERALEQATDHARRVGDLREEVENVAALTFTAVEGPLAVPDGMARCEATIAEHPNNRSVRARALRSLALLQAVAGDEAAEETMARSLGLFRELGQTYWLAVTRGACGRARWLLGDVEGAAEALQQSLDELTELGDRSQRSRVAALLAAVRAEAGDVDAARPLLEISRECADEADLEPQVGWRLAGVAVAIAGGDVEEAARLAAEAHDLLAPTDALLLRAAAARMSAHVHAASGEPHAAEASQREADELLATKLGARPRA